MQGAREYGCRGELGERAVRKTIYFDETMQRQVMTTSPTESRRRSDTDRKSRKRRQMPYSGFTVSERLKVKTNSSLTGKDGGRRAKKHT